MGAHVKRSFIVPSLPVGRVTAKLPWPNRPSGSGASKSNHGMDRQAMVPDFISKPFLPSKYGYQEVHAIYDEMRSFFAKRATSTHQNEVATIKVTLMSMKPNNRNPQMVMVRKITTAVVLPNADYYTKDITETVTNIPLSIGVSHLKAITYFTILPLFLKWSQNYPLSIDEVKLRSKNWVELLPKGSGDEDVNAIENEFYTVKGKAKMRRFLPNKVLDLYLAISHLLRNEIEDHIEDLELNTVSSNFHCCVHPNSHVILLFQKRMSLNPIADGHNNPDEDRDAALPQIKFLQKNSKSISQPEVIEDVSIVVPAGPSAKRPERKRQRQVSVSNVYCFIYY